MTFDDAFERTLGSEGGYTSGAGDPGGETNWGISKRSYPHLDIKNLIRGQAKDIYRRDFWNRIHADTMPDGIAFQVFDFAVNSGIETAVRYLQRAIGVADDGFWGPVSRAKMDLIVAVNDGESDVLLLLNSERLDFMSRLSNWPTAGRGWARRIARNLRYGADDS